ncbi:unnamed protein product, partial [Heterosigma akashiwo]
MHDPTTQQSKASSAPMSTVQSSSILPRFVKRLEYETLKDDKTQGPERSIFAWSNVALPASYFLVGFSDLLLTPMSVYMVNEMGAEPWQQTTISVISQLPWSFKVGGFSRMHNNYNSAVRVLVGRRAPGGPAPQALLPPRLRAPDLLLPLPRAPGVGGGAHFPGAGRARVPLHLRADHGRRHGRHPGGGALPGDGGGGGQGAGAGHLLRRALPG